MSACKMFMHAYAPTTTFMCSNATANISIFKQKKPNSLIKSSQASFCDFLIQYKNVTEHNFSFFKVCARFFDKVQ